MIDATGVKVHVSPDNIWEFFQNNKGRLVDNKVVIAENTDTGYAVLLTNDYDGVANLIVERNEERIYNNYEWSSGGCYSTYRQLIGKYLLPVTEDEPQQEPARKFSDYDIPDDLPPNVTTDEEESFEDDELLDMEDAQYEREDELFLAMADYLSIAMNEGGGDGGAIISTYGTEFVNEVTDHVLEYLAVEQGIEIYRPTIFEDDNGEPMMTEFPYSKEKN